MLVGVATRQYERSLEPPGADVRARGTSQSAVSRRFVAQTQTQVDAWRAAPLADLDLAARLIDGVHVGGHSRVVALGIDTTGAKHPPRLGKRAAKPPVMSREKYEPNQQSDDDRTVDEC